MVTLAFVLVVCSGLMNAVWNLFTKRSLNKIVFLWSIHLIALLLYMPSFLLELMNRTILATGIMLIIVSMVFQGLYFLLLAKAYSIGDLSQVYPVMRGTGAMLVPMISVLFLDEKLHWIGWAGLAVLVLGIVSMSDWRMPGRADGRSTSKAPLALAFGIGLCITGYTLTDKLTLEHISPLALIQVSHIGYMLTLTWGAVRSGQLRREWETNWKTILLGAILAPGGYLLFLFAMDLGQVAQLAPIREVGIVFGTLFGIFLLKEKQGTRRIVSAALIVIGVVLIKGWG